MSDLSLQYRTQATRRCVNGLLYYAASSSAVAGHSSYGQLTVRADVRADDCPFPTHGQCNVRPTVTFPAAERHLPFDHWYQIILHSEQRHMRVNNLPKVVTWHCPGLKSNLQPQGYTFGTLLLYHYKTLAARNGNSISPSIRNY